MISKICCFCGHGKDAISEDIKTKLYNVCEILIINENVKEFWVGNYGNFDITASKVVKTLQEKYSDVKINLVIPYVTKSVNDCKEYYKKNFDNIIIAEFSEKTPAKYRILKCNQYMVDNSDFLVAYVDYSWGGAAKTLEYAVKKLKGRIINLGNYSYDK